MLQEFGPQTPDDGRAWPCGPPLVKHIVHVGVLGLGMFGATSLVWKQRLKKKFPPGFHFVQAFLVMPTAQSCLPRSLGLNLKESMSCAVQALRIRLTLLCARTARSAYDCF